MLYIRYSLISGMLSGWSEEAPLEAREGEGIATLDMQKPDVPDYEYFAYINGQLMPSGKTLLHCPEFSPSNPQHNPPARIEHIEEYLVAVSDFCKAKFS